jgi:hypothetical protein
MAPSFTHVTARAVGLSNVENVNVLTLKMLT